MQEFRIKRFAIMLASCFLILDWWIELVWKYLRFGVWFAVWPKRFQYNKAELTCDNVTKHYYGLSETTFKTRYNNHKHPFRHQDKRYSTELCKAYWNAIETGKYSNPKWNIEKRTQPYQHGFKECNLCLEKNFDTTSKSG